MAQGYLSGSMERHYTKRSLYVLQRVKLPACKLNSFNLLTFKVVSERRKKLLFIKYVLQMYFERFQVNEYNSVI